MTRELGSWMDKLLLNPPKSMVVLRFDLFHLKTQFCVRRFVELRGKFSALSLGIGNGEWGIGNGKLGIGNWDRA
jgi:hypothetical protein